MKTDYYDDRECEPAEIAMDIAARCGRFDRRNGVTAFNMTDYRSCENCSHLTAENRCALRMDERLGMRG